MKIYSLFAICSTLLVSGALHAEAAIPLHDGQAGHSFGLCVALNTGEGFEPSQSAVELLYRYAGARFSALGGIKCAGSVFAFTGMGMYWLYRSKRQAFGGGGIYHCDVFADVSVTNDFLLGVRYAACPVWWFSLSAHAYYFYKVRTIFALGRALTHHTGAVLLRLQFRPVEWLSLYAAVATYETFRFMVLASPSFIAGMQAWIQNQWSIDFEAVSHYIDFFTLSAAREDVEFRVSVWCRL
ncbi:MAG: hypothetical protein IJ191_00395 [Treponema sp.]|nr:hypothetical protein [Treponema sp.]